MVGCAPQLGANSAGPMRKYDQITPKGAETFTLLYREWEELVRKVRSLSLE